MIALRALGANQGEAISAHLLALSAQDRADRFNGSVNDEHVRRYVQDMLTGPGVVIGALQGERVIGLVHAAIYQADGHSAAEIGVSVASDMRRHGLGKRLLAAAGAALAPLGLRRAALMFRSGNPSIAALVRSAGGRVQREGSEAQATVEFAPTGRWQAAGQRVRAVVTTIAQRAQAAIASVCASFRYTNSSTASRAAR